MSGITSFRYWIGPALGMTVAIGASASYGAAITAPYHDDFNDGVAQDFAPGGQVGGGGGSSSTWTATGTTYQNELAGDPGQYATTVSYATVKVDNLGAATDADFVLSSDFTVTAVDGNSSTNQRIGFAVLSTTNTPRQYDGGASYYYADYLVNKGSTQTTLTTGSMRIMAYDGSGASGSALAAGQFDGTVALNTTYRLTLTGDYTVDGLVLSFTVDDPSDGNAATVITADAIGSPKTGQWFGYRNRVQAGSQTAVMDNFRINDVPEPASAALVGLGGLLAAGRRRRR